jgi:Rps23 Pro-64 3,4-dihydroxylase Tpa1-like proline 4-hydroxylase
VGLISSSLCDWLSERSSALHEEYIQAKPFSHLVLKDLFNFYEIDKISRQFPKVTDGTWWKYENVLEKKLARNDIHNFPGVIQNFIYELMSNRFVHLLEKITGIDGLIVDHTLNGGGLHQIIQGGKLDIHADYNYHPMTRLDRRVNVLIYLNPNWQKEWKGALELWDEDMQSCVHSIQPMLNTMVIFSTTDRAFHGHPDPLECPEGESRKSIALYYYSNGRPESERSAPHSTIFKKRPNDPWDEMTEDLRKKRAHRRMGNQTT